MPWGVFAANMVGSLLFGLIWAMSEERGWIGENLRIVALVGFMGAFTTFSTLAFDNVQMARASEWGWFTANLTLTNVGGLAFIYAGFRIAKALHHRSICEWLRDSRQLVQRDHCTRL